MSEARDWLKRRPRLYWVLRRSRMAVGRLLPPVQLDGVPGRVHRNDTMIPKRSPEHADGYNWSGHLAAEFVVDAVAATGRQAPPETGLDLGCGFGRVLRHLVTRFPDTQWTACDIEPDAVRFCAKEFHAVPLLSKLNLNDVTFPNAPYDVVFMGSVLTHLDAEASTALVAALARITRPGAVIAFSSQPPELTANLAAYGPGMDRFQGQADAELASVGFSYVPYTHYSDGSYGIAFFRNDELDRVFDVAFAGAVERVDLGERPWMAGQIFHAYVVTGSST